MDRQKALDMALGQIEKQHGKGAIMKMGEKGSMTIETIPTGALSLDLALGVGGLPRGRVTEIFGPESSGKSTLAMHVVAEAQRNGGICAYIDAEHAMDPVYARAIGVDVDELLISQPDTGEQALEIADTLVRSGALDVVVIDSVAALTPRAEIEGEMGDAHVGLQARLMSQALRKLTANLNRSNTICIFINQLREKIGVLFGCLSGDTRITLADGTQEKIGEIVNQKLPVEVLSYDPDLGAVVPKKVVNWFDNGRTDHFLQFTVARGGGNGTSQFAVTPNHKIRTPAGWREAQELAVGDRVLQAVPFHLSDLQWEALLGMLMGDGALSPTRSGHGTRPRWGHGAEQAEYCEWKASLFANIGASRSTNEKGAVFYDLQPLPELADLRQAVYVDGKKVLSHDYLKRLTPLSIALWYMDDASFTIRPEGLQRTEGGSGRAEICVQAMEATTRRRVVDHLAGTWGIQAKLLSRQGKAIIQFPTAETAKLHALIAPYVHPSMEHKLLPRYRGRFGVEPDLRPVRIELVPMPIVKIAPKPPTRNMHRFDIEVEGTHNYFADGVMVHNSPETTPGGRALKFYSSIRLDIRRIESIKDGAEVVGNRVRVKVVKNKCLAAGTTVFDPTTGTTHPIEDIVAGAGTTVVAADKLGKLHVRPIVSRMDQGEQEVIGLHLHDGTALWVTPDHKVLTDRGWCEAGRLSAGDRVARPRQAIGFGDHEPVPPEQARMLGYLIGNGHVSAQPPIPAAFFAPETSADVVANLLLGIWETDGHLTREQTGGLRVGFTTTSEQLAQQIHWLLLRWEIGSSVRVYDPRSKRPGIVEGRRVQGKLPCWEVRVAGIDDVERFSRAVPMWGPRGQALTDALADPALGRHHGSPRSYLATSATDPVLAHLRAAGITPALAAQLIGPTAGRPSGGLKQVLGVRRIRRDRLTRLAEALDSHFLRSVLDEDVWYDRVVRVSPPEWRPTYDIEVDELHTLVANDVVVHNCAPPFRQAEFDIQYSKGISREGSLLDIAVDLGIVKKSGAWYTYDDEQLGQGRENAKSFLGENPELMVEISERIRQQVGLDRGDAPAEADANGAGDGREVDPDDEPISLD